MQRPIGDLYKLTSENVEFIFHDSLWEETDDKAITVEGVLTKATFSAKRIEQHELLILTLLKQLPSNFRKDVGGGWSFLNLCDDAEGNQWAGLHVTMDKLICLGMAIGRVTLTDKKWNEAMPGGVPFVFVDVSEPTQVNLENVVSGPEFSLVVMPGSRPHVPALFRLLVMTMGWIQDNTLSKLELYHARLSRKLALLGDLGYEVGDLQIKWLEDHQTIAIASGQVPVQIYATIARNQEGGGV